MKYGIRTPNIKKSIKARTTGKVKRQLKSAVNPLYGKKGMGIVNDPKKAIYNKVYNKTSVGVADAVRSVSATQDTTNHHVDASCMNTLQVKSPNLGDPNISDKKYKVNGTIFLVLAIIFALIGIIALPVGIILLLISALCFWLWHTAKDILHNRKL